MADTKLTEAQRQALERGYLVLYLWDNKRHKNEEDGFMWERYRVTRAGRAALEAADG